MGLERAGFKCVGQVEIMPYALKVLNKHWKNVPKHTDILTLLRSASLVRIYQTPTQKEKVLRAKEALSSLSVCELSISLTRLGYLLRMFPDSFPLTEAGIWQSSFKRWPKVATGGLTGYWTASISESPNDAKECLLSEVLETQVHPKYYLSHKAVAGMIRRSKKWGRGGYVFLLNAEKGKTRHLTLLSLNELEKVCIRVSGQEENQEIGYRDMLPKLSEQPQEETLPLYGRTLILRKLTPTEKEKLQGFPQGWTLAEE